MRTRGATNDSFPYYNAYFAVRITPGFIENRQNILFKVRSRMESSQSHSEITVGSERGFGFVFSAAFAILSFYPLLHDRPPIYALLGVAAGFLLVALFIPRILRPLNILWFKFGMLLAKIIQPIVMAAIFYLVVTPIGLIMRAFGKDLLRQKMSKDSQTYWQDRSAESDRMGSMKDQF